MIHAREAREIMNNAFRDVYEGVVSSIHQGIVKRSEEGYSHMPCRVAPDLFEQYEDELMNLLKESGYHVSKPSKSSELTYFMISWKEENPFLEHQSEQPKWWQFWK